jgi:DNA (cytosine-5)-methyltransferase 1
MVAFADFFAGIGGFRIGIETAFASQGIVAKCVYSCDIKEHALRVYNKNFAENNTRSDVSTIDIQSLPHFDILCGGFPCQPFSSAGNKKGLTDKRGNLIYKIIEICQIKKPKIVFLENVPNLLSIDKGKTMESICQEFRDIGYYVSYCVLDASEFGVPQQRKRLFIVGCKEQLVDLSKVTRKTSFPLKHFVDVTDNHINIPKNFYNALCTVEDKVLQGSCIKDKRGGKKNIHSWDIGLHGVIDSVDKSIMNKIMTERRKKHWAEKKKISWMDGMPLTGIEISSFVDLPFEELHKRLENLSRLGYLRKEKPKDVKDGRRVYKEEAEEGYNINKGKLSFPLSQILDLDGYAPTLTATDSRRLGVKIDNVIRTLNKKELRAICGFPESFNLEENVDYYDLFGNMVCPPVVSAICDIIIKDCFK